MPVAGSTTCPLPGENQPRWKQNFGTSTIDRASRRSNRSQAINPLRRPAMPMCWVTRLSIRQRTSGATPCEAGVWAQQCAVFDERRNVEELNIFGPRHLQCSTGLHHNQDVGWAETPQPRRHPRAAPH